jgi:hypothetical protein
MSDNPIAQSDEADPNRGKRAPAEGSGAVTGSGAGAGGGGGSEDYDDDVVGGGGTIKQTPDRPAANTGADASSHGSR